MSNVEVMIIEHELPDDMARALEKHLNNGFTILEPIQCETTLRGHFYWCIMIRKDKQEEF